MIDTTIKNNSKTLCELMNLDYEVKMMSDDFAEKLSDAFNWNTCLLCNSGKPLSPTATCKECNIFLDRKFKKTVKEQYVVIRKK